MNTAKSADYKRNFFTKKVNVNERIPDHIRIKQVVEQEKEKQYKRDSWV
jgi:hypothetical protein